MIKKMVEKKEKQQEQAQQAQQTQQVEQDRMIRLSLLEQEARQLEQQLRLIEQQIVGMQVLKLNLDELEKAKPKDEMLTGIGRNIFVKTSLLSKDLWVDVGAKTVVKKNISETKEIIDKDVNKLMEARNNLTKQLEQVAAGLQNISQIS